MKMFIAAIFAIILSVGSLLAADDPKPHLPTPPCPNCQCGCTVTGKCICKDCDHPQLTKSTAKLPDYKWVRHSDGDVKELALMLNGKQVGGWNVVTKKYMVVKTNGEWSGEWLTEAPIPVPTEVSKVTVYVEPTPTYTSQPQYYYGSFQQGGGCAGGSCGSSRGTGRFRR